MVRMFWQPPHHVDPELEQKQGLGVYKVLRDAVSFLAAIRAEVRLLRREQQQHREEVQMSFKTLSDKVDELIDLANSLPVGGGGATIVEVDELEGRVTSAVDTLKAKVAAPAPMPPAPPFPPVVTPPVDPITGLPVDPNAPVQ